MNDSTMGTASYTLASWQVKFSMRAAQLEVGQWYNISLYKPRDGEPMWTITALGKVENGR